ncbi:lamin tail domain-containing protein [uncultured Tenacibaculum sp.]|uniref:lamin tail domain-containing protein n=1 Tax=uncultured Tenacibaculum sp. TaxID=174713 RepID=UPI0026244525|nr:lamin tail domain-containing protein [uncultured Tenacibaculum sp.]
MRKNYSLKILFFIFFMAQVSFGQSILTFDFNSLAGSEATASSNSNDSNIMTSSISRGSGLTASNNGNRFNATSWNTGTVDDAITGNDYMEFTITPNATFQFTVSSIDVNVQRSGSGPRAVSLRSSVDGYAANLDAEKTILDNTSTQTFTFTFAQAASTSAVTYRFYLHSAEGTGGSGGFEGSGNDITVNGTVTAASSDPAISFDSASSSVDETDATFNTTIPVTIINYAANVTIGVTVDGSSTAEAGDYTLNTSSITFTGNGTQNVSLDINDDADYLGETVVLNIAVTSGTALLSTSQHTVTINDDDLPIVINEINADPDVTNGDANGDGVVNTSQDEFVEIYNVSGANLNISGWVVADVSGDRHTFPNGTIVPANEAIVVFGGGTPTTVPGLVQTASGNSLSLNNSGDTVIIKDNSGTTIVSETYGSEGGDNQSLARNVDFTGAFVKHSTIVSNAVLFSPGRDNTDNTPFSSDIKWTGASDNNWATAANWLGNTVPSSGSNVVIPAGLANYPTVSSNITVNTIKIASGASLVANASITGDLTYKRTLTANWHLVSAPVEGESIQDLISNHVFATGTGSNIGIAPYDNAQASGSRWTYQTGASMGTLNNAQGYSVKLEAEGPLSFTGRVNNTTTNITLTKNTNAFNLVGNPFASYVNSGTLLTDNTTKLESQTIWLWNGTAYETKVSGDNFVLAPGQGFFVEAKNGSEDLTFNTSYQSHNSTDTFQRSSSKSEIELFVSNGKENSKTKFYFIEGTTKGFDNGYDGKMFTGISSKFSVYSELVNDNKGINYAIQALPKSEIDGLIIPLGLDATASKNIEFSIDTKNIPEDIFIYLEDRVNKTITNLSETTYKTSIKGISNGIGQFYIHTISKKLDGLTNLSIDDLSIYKSAPNTLTIVGLQAEASLKIFSILGKELVSKEINSNGVSNIDVPSLAAGAYIVEITSEKGKTSKKIILD